MPNNQLFTLKPFINLSDKSLLTILFLAYLAFGTCIFAFLSLSVLAKSSI